ncbi:MAG: thioesterase family protein [Bacteroidales bacterium]
MNTFQTGYRVSYSDTDQMGFMHHSNYLKYYETARWELFRSIGIPYPEIEKDGIILPVIDASLKFIKPTYYDQKILINTKVKAQSGARIIFDYQAINEAGEIINEAHITVACVKKSTGKACIPSKKIKDALNELINK